MAAFHSLAPIPLAPANDRNGAVAPGLGAGTSDRKGSYCDIAFWVHDLAAYSSCPVARGIGEETGIEVGAVHYHSLQPLVLPG